MRRLSLLIYILSIFISIIFAQCEAGDANRDSIDMELAFPELGEKASACDHIENFFRLCEQALVKLQQGEKLFSPDNTLNLQFFLHISHDLGDELKRRYLKGAEKRVFFKPTISIFTYNDGYSQVVFSMMSESKELVASISCRGGECNSFISKLNPLKNHVYCLQSNRYFLRLDETWSVEFGKEAGDQSISVKPFQPIVIMESLIQMGETTEELWEADKASYDWKSTITLRQVRPKRSAVRLKLCFPSSLSSTRKLAAVENFFFSGLAYAINLCPAQILFNFKPKSKDGGSWKKAKKRLGL